MDPENKHPPEEAPEQEIEKQLASSAVYAAKAIRLGVAVITGGISKIGGFLWGLVANWVVGSISFGGLHGPVSPQASKAGSFYNKHKAGILILCLVIGVVVLPFFLLSLHWATTSTMTISEPPLSNHR